MTHQVRASLMIGVTLLVLFFASWVLTSVLTGNPIKAEFYDTLDSQLAGRDYSGNKAAFAIGMALALLIGCNVLVTPLMGWTRYTRAFFMLSALVVLLIGIGVGTRPYTFHFGIVEKDNYSKQAIPLRGLIIYSSIVVGGFFSFIFLWLDNRNKTSSTNTPANNGPVERSQPQDSAA